MGLDNLKKKLQSEGKPEVKPRIAPVAKPKIKLPFQRIVIGEEKGKLKAKSVPISFEQFCRDLEEGYGEDPEEEQYSRPTCWPPRELTPRERRQEIERQHEEIRRRYRRSGLIPPF